MLALVRSLFLAEFYRTGGMRFWCVEKPLKLVRNKRFIFFLGTAAVYVTEFWRAMNFRSLLEKQ